jgi:hypothetical protein
MLRKFQAHVRFLQSSHWIPGIGDHSTKIRGRVDVKPYYLGMLCVPSFSSLSIEECHNILPCKRALRPSQNRTCGFPTSDSSAKLTHRTTVYKHTIHAICSVPAKAIIASLQSPLRYEGNIDSVMLSLSVCGIRPLHFAARSFGCPGLTGLDGHYPIYTPNMT